MAITKINCLFVVNFAGWLLVGCGWVCLSHQVRLLDRLINNIFGWFQLISLNFCMEIIIKWGSIWDYHFWLDAGRCVSSNQIGGFFDQQYLWNKSIVFSVFYAWSYAPRQGGIWDCHFWLGVTSCASCPIRLQDSLVFFLERIN